MEVASYVGNIRRKHSTLPLLIFRSDAQRAAKQKEAKERELEAHSFNADRIEEGGFPVSMVSSVKSCSCTCNFKQKHSY